MAHSTKNPRDAGQDVEPFPLSQARRLVQIIIVLNLFLLSTSVVLPSYSNWQLARITDNLLTTERIRVELMETRKNYLSFYSSEELTGRLRDLWGRVQQAAGTSEYPREFNEPGEAPVAEWAYVCPQFPPPHDKQQLYSNFARAYDMLNTLLTRRLGIAGANARGQLESSSVDEVLAFGCAVVRIKQALADPEWRRQRHVMRDRQTGLSVSTHFDSLAEEVSSDLAVYQDRAGELYALLPGLAAKALVPIKLSEVQDLQQLEKDFKEQFSAWLRNQAEARYSVPVIGLSVDVRSIEYAVLAVMLVLLIEAFVFHHSVLSTVQRKTGFQNRLRSRYFHCLLLKGFGRGPSWPAHAGTALLKFVLAALLLGVPLLVALFQFHAAFSRGLQLHALVFPSLCVALTALVFANLSQLLAMERGTLLDSDPGGYLANP